MNGATSGWKEAARGVLRGSIPGPGLFNMYVNDLDAGIECTIRDLDDESKPGGSIDCLMGQEAFQKDLDRLVH